MGGVRLSIGSIWWSTRARVDCSRRSLKCGSAYGPSPFGKSSSRQMSLRDVDCATCSRMYHGSRILSIRRHRRHHWRTTGRWWSIGCRTRGCISARRDINAARSTGTRRMIGHRVCSLLFLRYSRCCSVLCVRQSFDLQRKQYEVRRRKGGC